MFSSAGRGLPVAYQGARGTASFCRCSRWCLGDGPQQALEAQAYAGPLIQAFADEDGQKAVGLTTLLYTTL